MIAALLGQPVSGLRSQVAAWREGPTSETWDLGPGTWDLGPETCDRLTRAQLPI